MDAAPSTQSNDVIDVDGPAGGCSRPLLLKGMRRSCVECGRKKKSCDGQRPCSRCVRSHSRCTYSNRRSHLRPPHQQHHQPQRPDRDGMHALPHSFPGALMAYGKLPWKRCRFSASPATGLVGMQENVFLSDFFGCVGFLPLTTRSHIRETMVKIMMSPALVAFGGDHCGGEGHFDICARGGTLCEVPPRNQLPMDPSSCTFWCAVALGAIVKGSPIKSVGSYCGLAHEALAKSSGPADAELAKAWTILAYLHGFMGDMARFHEYMAFPDSFLGKSIAQGSTDALPTGFAEIIESRNCAKVSGDPCPVEPLCTQVQAPPQLNAVATEGELYRYIAQSLSAFEQAVYARASEERARARQYVVGDAEEPHVGDHHSQNFLRPGEVSDAMWALMGNGRFHFECESLGEVADCPIIRTGIGGMFINGPLVFQKAAKGNLHATLEKIGRCVDVLERYPGLCRGMMGCHTAHVYLACLAAVNDPRAREVYDRLREPYNRCRPAASQHVPPLDEWHGISAFCNHFYCRAMETLITSGHMPVFPAPSVVCIDDCLGAQGMDSDTGKGAVRPHDQSDSWSASASVVPEKIHIVGTGVFASPTTNSEVLADMRDDDLAAEDWLDVSYAMLDTNQTA